MNDQVEAAVGIVWSVGRFLASKRPATGYWEFSGGKIEAGAEPHAALPRELRVELGIHVREAVL
ncbi:MAG: NUDIX domain-containing protein [Desulfovibrio sp.]|jgi:8-oxo-dGTP diphosphatase|nr:NUDIX domain-containing protein [Desulfovibrio sp.]